MKIWKKEGQLHWAKFLVEITSKGWEIRGVIEHLVDNKIVQIKGDGHSHTIENLLFKSDITFNIIPLYFLLSISANTRFLNLNL